MGLDADHEHEDPPAGFDSFPGVEFYEPTKGALAAEGHFDKQEFAAYANSVTLTKLLLLMETPPDGLTGAENGADQLSALYSQLSGTTYDFELLNMHGAHGGNVLTSTLPGVGGTAKWMTSIDADNVWRQDSATTTSALFRVAYNNSAQSFAVYEETGLASGQYQVYATWQANVTQKINGPGDLAPRFIQGAEFAQYESVDVLDGEPAISRGRFIKNQQLFATDFEHEGMGFALLGSVAITDGTLRVRLNNLSGTGDPGIAGPILVVPAGGTPGTPLRIQNDRNPTTLAPLPGNGYADDGDFWTDLVYPTGAGNNPLWESALLRDGFRDLFTDWRNGTEQFPDLGDATSPDPNTAPIDKTLTQLPSHATPFGRVIEDNQADIPIPDSLRDLILEGLNNLVGLIENLEGAPPLNVTLPVLDKTLAEVLGLSDKVDETVRQPVVDYF